MTTPAPSKGKTETTRLEISAAKFPGKTGEYAVAREEVVPFVRHSLSIMNGSADMFSGDRANLTDYAEALGDLAGEIADGNLGTINQLLTAQALSLDTMFTRLLRSAQANMGEYPHATERYMRLAMKAQSQSRATLEALIRMHQPREQTVRHIHVGPEGQAVFIENMIAGGGSVRFDERAYASGPTGGAGVGPALLGQDEARNGVPIPPCEGQEAVPHARRRPRKRRAGGE